jgi:hypothetical protein
MDKNKVKPNQKRADIKSGDIDEQLSDQEIDLEISNRTMEGKKVIDREEIQEAFGEREIDEVTER